MTDLSPERKGFGQGICWDVNGISVLANGCTLRTWKDCQRSVVNGCQRNEVLQEKSSYTLMSISLSNPLCRTHIYLVG